MFLFSAGHDCCRGEVSGVDLPGQVALSPLAEFGPSGQQAERSLAEIGIKSKERIERMLQEIREHNGDHLSIVARLREIILATGSSIQEEVKYGGLRYSSNKAFCGVFSYKDHVTLELSDGATLSDPYTLLEGSGKQRRIIKFRESAEIEAKHAADYIKMARVAADS